MSVSLKDNVFQLVKDKYGTEPEYLWARYPEYAILRHSNNRKWYAAVMEIPRNKLGLQGDEKIPVINVKCGVILVGSLLMEKGFFPAYHMQKGKWVTVLLDGTVSMEQIEFLIDVSYDLTNVKIKGIK